MKRRKLPNNKVVSLDLYREKIEREERIGPREFKRVAEPPHILPIEKGDTQEKADMRFVLRWHGAYAFQCWLRNPLSKAALVKLCTMYPGNVSAVYSAEHLIQAALRCLWIRRAGNRFYRTPHKDCNAFMKLKLSNPRITK